MWIMIAGPYTSGAGSAVERAANLRRLNEAAVGVFEAGHVPIIGVNLALPVIDAAGEARFDEIMMPLSLALADRCDACLRVGGRSVGADAEMDRFRARGLPVYEAVADIPAARAPMD